MKKRYIILSVLLMILVIISGIFIYQKKQKVITIGIYSDSSWDVPNDNEYKFIDYVVKKFEKENPNVKVRYESGINKNDYLEWLSQKIVDNKAPDVFIVPSEQFGFLSSLGTMRNLNYFMDLSGLNTDDYYPTNLKAGMSAGKQYALPLESNPMMMCVNTDLLKKEHITIPKSGWTLNDFYRICRQVTKDTNHDGVVDQFGYADYSWKDAAQAYNAKLFNSQGTASYFNSDKVRQALTMMEKLYNLQKDYKVTADDFDKGKVAFLPMTLAQYRTYESYPYRVSRYSSFSWTCIRMPGATPDINSTYVNTSMVAMSSQSTHPLLSWKLVKFLSNNGDVQQKLFTYSQGASVLKSVMKSKDITENLQKENNADNALTEEKFASIMAKSQKYPEFKNYNNVMQTADYLINNALENGNVEVQLSNIQNQIQEELAK